MEELEDIFKDTKKRMQKGVFEKDAESQRKVDEIIKQMRDKILNSFPRGRASASYQRILDQALAELRGIANSTNTRPIQEMCDNATAVVSRTEKKIEEERSENLPEEERKDAERRTFGKGRDDVRQGRKDVNTSRAHATLEDAFKKAFEKISRAPKNDMGLRIPQIFSVEVTVDQVYKAYEKVFPQLFDRNISAVDQILVKEYDDLEQVTLGNLKRELLKEEQARQEVRAAADRKAPQLRSDILSDKPLGPSASTQEAPVLSSDYLDDGPLKPWDLRNYGTSAEKVNDETKKKLQEDKDKPKEPPKDLPKLSTDLII